VCSGRPLKGTGTAVTGLDVVILKMRDSYRETLRVRMDEYTVFSDHIRLVMEIFIFIVVCHDWLTFEAMTEAMALFGLIRDSSRKRSDDLYPVMLTAMKLSNIATDRRVCLRANQDLSCDSRVSLPEDKEPCDSCVRPKGESSDKWASAGNGTNMEGLDELQMTSSVDLFALEITPWTRLCLATHVLSRETVGGFQSLFNWPWKRSTDGRKLYYQVGKGPGFEEICDRLLTVLRCPSSVWLRRRPFGVKTLSWRKCGCRHTPLHGVPEMTSPFRCYSTDVSWLGASDEFGSVSVHGATGR